MAEQVKTKSKPGKKKRVRIIAIATVIVVVAGGCITFFTVRAASGSNDTTTTFRTVTAKTGNVNISVEGSGTVSDSTQLSLTSANAGTIDSLPVKQGDTVKAGQVIAHINDTTSAQTILQKKSQLESAKSALEQSEQNLKDLYIKTPIAGKVKSIVAAAGDDLADIKSLGDLAVISTGGAMTVTVQSSDQSLTAGESVKVIYKGSPIAGTVASAGGQQGTVIRINTDTPTVGATVTVKTTGGKTIGSGTLALLSSVSIQSSGTGTISNVYVTENQTVSKGQKLFKLDSSSAESDVELKQAAVEQAQNDLDNAVTSAGKDTITSPVAGVIAELSVKNGDSVAQGGTIATVIDPNTMQTVVSVDELDISSVKTGQKANITLDALSSKTFSGTVAQIDPIGTSSNGVTTYNVTVTIDNPENIKVGMTTDAEIITQSKENVVTLSASAVLNKRGSTGYVLDASKLVDSSGRSIQLGNVSTMELIQKYGKQVSIGLSNTDTVEITSGLSDGDQVAIPVTISKSAIKSLSNTTSTSTFSNFGGMGGMGGFGGYSGNKSDRTGGTGNMLSGGTTGTTGGTTGTTGTTGNTNGSGKS